MQKFPKGKLNHRYIKLIFDVLLWCSIIVYIFVMADLLLFRYISPSELFIKLFDIERNSYRAVNIIPFAGIFEYLFGNVTSFRTAAINIFGNIFVFMPFGLLLQLMRPKQSLMWTIVVVCVSSIAIELTQFITMVGSADVDDVILNTLGGLFGALAFILLNRLIKDRTKIRMLITVLAVICSSSFVATRGIDWI